MNCRSPVTMVVVTCATRLELTMNNLKSAVSFSRAPLRLLLYADVENIKRLQDRVRIREWPSSVLQRVTYSLRLVEFPKKSPHNWKELFGPCASQRLFLPSMLSEEDAVLYVDSDIVFFRPVEELWSIFDNMDDMQLAGLAPDVEDYNGSVYMHNWKTRYYGRYGLNSGVILMNLTRMRAYGLESIVTNLMNKYHSVMKLPDQDLLNMVFHDDPGRLYELPCRWDVLPPDCRAPASCLGQTAASLHGTDQFFVFPGREPAYHAVFLAMKK
ncbi:glycosyltransferase domain-containing protein, putative, partial [Ixodes scapularis]